MIQASRSAPSWFCQGVWRASNWWRGARLSR